MYDLSIVWSLDCLSLTLYFLCAHGRRLMHSRSSAEDDNRCTPRVFFEEAELEGPELVSGCGLRPSPPPGSPARAAPTFVQLPGLDSGADLAPIEWRLMSTKSESGARRHTCQVARLIDAGFGNFAARVQRLARRRESWEVYLPEMLWRHSPGATNMSSQNHVNEGSPTAKPVISTRRAVPTTPGWPMTVPESFSLRRQAVALIPFLRSRVAGFAVCRRLRRLRALLLALPHKKCP